MAAPVPQNHLVKEKLHDSTIAGKFGITATSTSGSSSL